MNNKQLLQQYVDTGIRLPEYQIKSLPSDLLKTYIRKRLIATEGTNHGILEDYEFELLTPDQQNQYIKIKVEYGNHISDKQFEFLTPDHRFQYVMKRIELGRDISDEHFELLTPDQQVQYLRKININ